MALDTIRAQAFGRLGADSPAHKAAMRARTEACRARYAACAEAGMTREEAAEALGVGRSAVKHAAWRYGLHFHGDRARECRSV